MAYRVIQWGSGNAGRHALRAILERSHLELVGLRCFREEKRGIDAGDVVGMASTGIRATTDVEHLLSLGADCVNWSAIGNHGGTGGTHTLATAVEEIASLLNAGLNVVSTGTNILIHPKAVAPELLDRLAEACANGGTTFYEGGCNPGFMMDILPITLSRMARSIDRIEMSEVCDMSRASRISGNDFIGFGKPPRSQSAETMLGDPKTMMFYASVLMAAEAIGYTIDDVRYEREEAVTESAIDVAQGRLQAGTVAALRLTYTARSGGRDVFTMNFFWRMTNDIRPEWPTGDRWIVEFQGDPGLRCELAASTESDARRPASIMAAMTAVNAIPTVCEAHPGVRTVLDLPLSGGGGLALALR